MKRTINKKAIIGIVGILFLVCSLISVLGTYETGNALESNDSKDTTTKSLEGMVSEFFPSTVVDGKNLKKIQTIVDGQTVTFLPAFKKRCPYNFYKKNNDGSFTELSEATGRRIYCMRSLAMAIRAAGPENVYTDATNATFYGTIDRTWNNTFKSNTIVGKSAELNPTFIKALDTAGVKTVYFANNRDYMKDTSTGNWSRKTNKEPQVGTVKYSAFYADYNFRNLLSSHADKPWSSRAHNSYYAYNWNVYDGCWNNCDNRDNNYAVVLSRAF